MSRFETWMERVDAILTRQIGCVSADLCDFPYMDWYGNGLTPEQVANDVVDEVMEHI